MGDKKKPFWKSLKVKIAGGILAAFAAAAVVDEFFLKEGYSYHQLQDPKDKAEQGLWSISVTNFRIPGNFGIPGIPDPVHNYINVRDPDGNFVATFHGLATDRETQVPEMWAMLPGNDLLPYVLPLHIDFPESVLSKEDMQGSLETDIFCGSYEAVCRKMLIALDACNAIRQELLRYEVFSQNSNSVAHTLVRAMDLEFPERNAAFWAPGHDHLLLKPDWQSKYETMDIPPHLLDPANLQKLFMYEMLQEFPIDQLGFDFQITQRPDNLLYIAPTLEEMEAFFVQFAPEEAEPETHRVEKLEVK